MIKNNKMLCAFFIASALFSLTASAAFKDGSAIKNKEAAAYLTETGVLNGYSDSTFRPAGNVTRAEFAKMVYIAVKETTDADGFINQAPELKDIVGHWANGYISALYKEGAVLGKTTGRFDPEGLITGDEMAKMLLTAFGTDAKAAGLTGANWMANTEKLADEKGMLEGYKLVLSDPATRDYAARMIFNALKSGNKAADYRLCAVTGIESNKISILDQDGRKESYQASDVSPAPEEGDIYYYKTDGSKLKLKKLNKLSDDTAVCVSGIQTYWSGDRIVTVDGNPYPTDENTVIFLKNNRSGLPGAYKYDFRVYKAWSLGSTFAGSAISDAVIDKSSGKAVARLIVCDTDTYDVSKRSAFGISYVTEEPFISVTGESHYIESYPMFCGRYKELYLMSDSNPGEVPSLKGQFVTFEVNSQGRLKARPTAMPISALSPAHVQNTFVLGEITGYEPKTKKIQIKASGEDRVFAFADDYKVIYLDTKKQVGADSGTIAKGNGKTNCVYYANSNNQILYLFIDVNGQIE
ncbi:MAG: S-layer homology domain-containing protein [Bacillota bacterium]|nr:S-layer homology domain-containing protein [Bacillota bacterium]